MIGKRAPRCCNAQQLPRVPGWGAIQPGEVKEAHDPVEDYRIQAFVADLAQAAERRRPRRQDHHRARIRDAVVEAQPTLRPFGRDLAPLAGRRRRGDRAAFLARDRSDGSGMTAGTAGTTTSSIAERLARPCRSSYSVWRRLLLLLRVLWTSRRICGAFRTSP